ncbi:MAG: glycosyltransferase [Ruminococcus flavefaciens]|nr:glycosyltransferase [Roseburia sp.]MCM1231437.1 glycosyltransferase [Ruminococcus flavefaciens]
MQNIALITAALRGGGAERCAANLSLIFAKKGFRVFLFTDLLRNVEYEYAGILVDYSFDVSAVDKIQEENPLWYKVEELKALKVEYDIDIAVSFLQWPNYLNILSKGREKVILTTHSVNSVYAEQEKAVFWSKETFCELYQYADFITFPSDFCRKDWLEHYGDQNGITRTVYNPIHRMKICVAERKENIVIAVGRMQGVKRQWHLIKAFAKVKKMCPDSKLIVLGDGELRSELETVVARYKLEDCVEMPGNVRNVWEYLEKAKVFAMTSKCEAMPCSVLEAMSVGLPVVSCDSPGGIREELGIPYKQNAIKPLMGKCGIITPYIKENAMEDISCEEEMFANEIVRLFMDNDLWNKLSAAAVERVQMFSEETVGKVWNALLCDSQCRKINREEFEKVREKNLNRYQNTMNAAKIQMYSSYFRLLEKWMVLHEKGESIREYFVSRKMKNIIIYGMGKMAYHLLEDIKGSSINIICAVDRKMINKDVVFPVITPEEPIPDADCIVVTPVHEFEMIKSKLMGRTSVPLISLEDVIAECSI